ncbi:MAG: hypothetical protein GY867_05845, partial [bacterium]|nr:hypothetical protein [bacterium]
MSFETYIARRYFRSGRFFVSVSTWFTIAGVTLGVAVVCFVMSMHNGFESEIRARLLGTTSHITVFPIRGGFISEYQQLVDRLEQFDHVVAASPFVYYKAAVSSPSAGDGIIVRGIDLEQERRSANIGSSIISGEYSFEPTVIQDDTIPGILLGSGLASRLGVFIGDPVVLYSMRGEELRRSIRPRIAQFHVSGVF